MTEKEAKAYFEQLHPKTGELSDDELDNVAGGGCHAKDGRLVVSIGHLCEYFSHKSCGGVLGKGHHASCCNRCEGMASCSACNNCTYEKGL